MSTQTYPIVSATPPSYRTPSPISPPAGAIIGKKSHPVTADWGELGRAEGIMVGDPIHVNPDNPQFVPPHVTICSVFPGALATPFMAFRCVGYPQFVIPAPPVSLTNPLGFSCLRVYDTVAVVADSRKIENSEWDGSDGQTLQPIPALDPSGNGGLAFDIVQKFGGSMLGANPNRQLGVGIIRGDLPTKAELERLLAIQTALFTYYVNDGDELAQKNQVNKIGAFHRFALEQLGDMDPARHPWHKEIRKQAMKGCFGCGRLIIASSTTCPECRQDLIRLAFERWEKFGDPMLTPEQDPVVFAWVEKAIAKASQSSQQVSAQPSHSQPRAGSTPAPTKKE